MPKFDNKEIKVIGVGEVVPVYSREEVITILDKIKEEIKDNTYFINETTEKEGIDFETVEKIIDKYKGESEE